MNERTNLMVSYRTVGEFSVDGSSVRARSEGASPELVIPLRCRLRARDDASAIALVQLRAELWLSKWVGHLSHCEVAMLDGRFAAGKHEQSRELELPFSLTADQVEMLAASAPPTRSSDMEFVLAFDPTLAWVSGVNVESGAEPHGLPAGLSGLNFVNEIRPLTLARAEELRVRLPREHWAERILPGLGADRFRLAAIELPWSSDAASEVRGAFDQARADLDSGRYRECIEKCRDVRYVVERRLQGTDTSGKHVATRVAEARGIEATSSLIKTFDGCWQALVEATNAAHHDASWRYSAVEARFCLLLTATLLDTLGRLQR